MSLILWILGESSSWALQLVGEQFQCCSRNKLRGNKMIRLSGWGGDNKKWELVNVPQVEKAT